MALREGAPMTLEFDHEEDTPDGRFRIRRVSVDGGVQELTPGVLGIFTKPLHDWYVAAPLVDRWLRFGQTSEPVPANRFVVLDHPEARRKLLQLLAAYGRPWEGLEEPTKTVTEEARDVGAGSGLIVDGELVEFEDPEAER
jgi:hypothetical protein